MASSSSSSSEPVLKRAAVTRTCGICKCDFPGDDALYAHVEANHTKPWVKGVVCNWDGCTYSTASSKCDYRVHLRTHTNEKPFSCDVCDYVCTQSGALRSHIRTHSGNKPYLCNICNMSLTTSSNLSTHMRTHSGKKPYSCDICGMSFRQTSHLIRHMRRHTGERPFSCDICDMSFKQSGHLSTHMHIHSGKKPYSCDTCDLSFTQSGNLTRHMLIHTDEKPYSCNICDMSFREFGHLRKHTRTHSGEKPYPCSICVASFADSSALKRHKLTHTAPKCVYCGERPLSRDSLMCGFCDNKYSWQYHVKEKAVFSFLAEFDLRLAHFVRDQNIGCGVRRRPDGYLDLIVTVGDGRVLFIVEVDEDFHRRNDIKCEFVRLQDIMDAHRGALYVLRYNPDQRDGLGTECLTALSQRCLDIIDGEYENALKDENCALIVEYIGYPEARVELCNRTWFQSQIELLSQHHVDG